MKEPSREDARPIEPEGSLSDDLIEMAVAWNGLAWWMRVSATVYLGIAAWGGLHGGWALAQADGGWLGWTLSLLVLEPVGIACALGAVFVWMPRPLAGSLLAGALRRAQLALWGVVAAAFGYILVGVGALAYALWIRPLVG